MTNDDVRRGPYGGNIYGDRPIVGDWNNDGRDEVGILRRWSKLAYYFYFDMDGNYMWDFTAVPLTSVYSRTSPKRPSPLTGEGLGRGCASSA